MTDQQLESVTFDVVLICDRCGNNIPRPWKLRFVCKDDDRNRTRDIYNPEPLHAGGLD